MLVAFLHKTQQFLSPISFWTVPVYVLDGLFDILVNFVYLKSKNEICFFQRT